LKWLHREIAFDRSISSEKSMVFKRDFDSDIDWEYRSFWDGWRQKIQLNCCQLLRKNALSCSSQLMTKSRPKRRTGL
jgi:hypothetical protein